MRLHHRLHSLRAVFAALIGLSIAAAAPALAQPTAPGQPPSWIIPDLIAAARAEGSLTVYSSINEQEGLPLWKLFEDATGVKVNYVRSSDFEHPGAHRDRDRARQRTWDLAVTTTVNRLPNEVLLQFDPPEARALIPQARDPNRRWYGVYANYNTPAYNTNLVKKAELPQSYEEFLDRKQWAGKIALDDTDDEWLSAIIIHYGEERGKKLLKDIVAALKPIMVDGHLALARSVGAGEYWLALNNYASLTVNVQLAGAPIDFWALDPVALFFGSVGISAQAPHPKAAQLAANFMLSREAEQFLTRRGRMPTRLDVPVNPPCHRRVEGPQNHCHYLRRGRAEEMAGAVQGNLPGKVSIPPHANQTDHHHARVRENVGRHHIGELQCDSAGMTTIAWAWCGATWCTTSPRRRPRYGRPRPMR